MSLTVWSAERFLSVTVWCKKASRCEGLVRGKPSSCHGLVPFRCVYTSSSARVLGFQLLRVFRWCGPVCLELFRGRILIDCLCLLGVGVYVRVWSASWRSDASCSVMWSVTQMLVGVMGCFAWRSTFCQGPWLVVCAGVVA